MKAVHSSEVRKLLLKPGEEILRVGASEEVAGAPDLGGNRIELRQVDLRGLASSVKALELHDLDAKHFLEKDNSLDYKMPALAHSLDQLAS